MDKILTAAIVGVICFFTVILGGRLEGMWWPVVDRVTVDPIEPVRDTSSRIWGEFHIIRPECDFRAIEWLFTGSTREPIAPVDFEEGTKARDGGYNTFGPWRVLLTPSQLKSDSRAIALHRCYFWKGEVLGMPVKVPRPWLTETHFYP